MKDSKKILMSIIGVIIIIIIIIAILVLTLNKSNSISAQEKGVLEKEYEEYLNTLENPASIVNGKKPEPVKMENIYFNAKNSIDKYFNYIQKKNFEAILAVLDQEYVNTNELEASNVLSAKFIPKSAEDFRIEDMYSLDGSNYTVFYVKGEIKEEPIYLIVNIDFKNKTFSMIPSDQKEYEDKINTVIEGQTGKEKEIEANEFNALEVSTLQEDEIASKYLLDFKEKMISNPDIAYTIIDEEYKEKRFPSLSDFQSYIQENRQKIQNTTLVEYSVESRDGYKQYTCLDNYGNYYIFNVTAAMKYTVLLDNYTVETEEFKSTYDGLNESNKIATNIEKFIKCINNKDYNQAYSFLDEEFKNNYFKDVNRFKEYVENNFYENNILGKIDIKNEGNIFICKVPIKSGISASAKKMTKTFIMQLKEGTEFVMSFSVE